MDALGQALESIHLFIQRPILEAAFNPEADTSLSLDELIREKVLNGYVRKRASIRGGKIHRIILHQEWCEHTSSPSPWALGVSGSFSEYRVPPEAREHRDIACVLQVRFPYSLGASCSGGFYNNCAIKGNTLSQIAGAALQAQTYSNILANPQGIVLPGNIIKLEPPQINYIQWMVYVRLMYDENFSHIQESTIDPFCDVCVTATKQYCFNELHFKVESNAMYHGMELGVFKDTISQWSDLKQTLDEQILALGGSEFYDPDRARGILQRMVR